jgi:hypothetical protein
MIEHHFPQHNFERRRHETNRFVRNSTRACSGRHFGVRTCSNTHPSPDRDLDPADGDLSTANRNIDPAHRDSSPTDHDPGTANRHLDPAHRDADVNPATHQHRSANEDAGDSRWDGRFCSGQLVRANNESHYRQEGL